MQKILFFCFTTLLLTACMTPQKSHILTLTSDDGKKVAEIALIDSVLNGPCTWWDLEGNKIAFGEFKDGKPWEGTILNWAKFSEIVPEAPFSYDFYCQDWITFFEISHASQRPDYGRVSETYHLGEKVPTE
jgi:hypothetical protein